MGIQSDSQPENRPSEETDDRSGQELGFLELIPEVNLDEKTENPPQEDPYNWSEVSEDE